MAAGFGLLLVVSLSGCDSTDRTAPVTGVARLPHAVLIDDGPGGRHHLHVAPVVDRGTFTSGFGVRRKPLGGASNRHDGIDIAAPEGTPVRAAADGTIARIGRHGTYGRFILIRHSDRLTTLYAHLSRFTLNLIAGSAVRQDEVIGHVGATGRATGNHLHFEVRRDGRPIDPLALPALARGG